MEHDHHHFHVDATTSTARLFITMALNFLITVVELIGGLLSGSLSLLSDALHNFSDGISIIISYIAVRMARQPRSARYTFGLKRAEILAAVINAVVDALGGRDIEMPATPERVWRVMRAGGAL